ncbi:MAG: leucine-rich repeat domain-containing protein, partial [Clostridia bacterium]|nr:leucine-rich repeat domain-containing protein [Clostridia bacterium]
SLTSIIIGNGVTSIGKNAFYNCPIENATIPTIAISYIPKTKLKTVVINGGTSIGYEAFYGCTSLTSVTIPNSVTSIGGYAFRYCTGLTSIVVPDSITSIENGAFYDCTGLTSVTIPDSVTSIGDFAFYDCKGLTSITIGNSVTKIGYAAFSGCPIENATIPTIAISYIPKTKLKTVVINGGTSIGSNAFQNCTSLTSVTIPGSVTTIEYRAFQDCTSLTSIVIPDSVTTIGDGAFSYCYKLTIYCEAKSKPSGWDSDWNYSDCPVVWSCNNNDTANDGYIYTIIDGVRYGIINNKATVVRQPSSIKEVIIPNIITYQEKAYPVTSIGRSAFSGCTGLTSVTIPDSVTSIGSHAFDSCTSLTSITIPDSVTSIGDFAFDDCTALTIYCEAESKPSGWGAYWNDSDCPVVWGYKE